MRVMLPLVRKINNSTSCYYNHPETAHRLQHQKTSAIHTVYPQRSMMDISKSSVNLTTDFSILFFEFNCGAFTKLIFILFFLFLSHCFDSFHLSSCTFGAHRAGHHKPVSQSQVLYRRLGVELVSKSHGTHRSWANGCWSASWVSPTGLLETEVQDGTS